jgi:hypothetical protein
MLRPLRGTPACSHRMGVSEDQAQVVDGNRSSSSSSSSGAVGQPPSLQGQVLEVDVNPGLQLQQPYNGLLWVLAAAVLTVVCWPVAASCARLSAISRRLGRRPARSPQGPFQVSSIGIPCGTA